MLKYLTIIFFLGSPLCFGAGDNYLGDYERVDRPSTTSRVTDRKDSYAAYKKKRDQTHPRKVGSLRRIAKQEGARDRLVPISEYLLPLSWEEAESQIFNGKTWNQNHVHWSWHKKWFECMGVPSIEPLLESRTHRVIEAKRILKSVLEGTAPEEHRIPHVMHRVWVTASENPYEVPEDRLTCYLSTIENELPSDWQHFFWCLDRSVIPATVSALERSGRVQVRELKEIWDEMRGRDVFGRLLSAKLFALCCDVARYNLVYLLGGGLYRFWGAI
ncbi:hypothetical protein OAN21_02765 [Alphaproteobacteria bacterium]|nr:hypothetical protein [Alphaproteobacteria bacterium]